MRIEPYKDWIIRSDSMNVILCKSAGMVTVDKDTGKQAETFKDETYHRTVGQALRALCDKELNASKCTTFKGFQNECKQLKQMIDRVSKELGEEEVRR